jgi:hypothetical protein
MLQKAKFQNPPKQQDRMVRRCHSEIILKWKTEKNFLKLSWQSFQKLGRKLYTLEVP